VPKCKSFTATWSGGVSPTFIFHPQLEKLVIKNENDSISVISLANLNLIEVDLMVRASLPNTVEKVKIKDVNHILGQNLPVLQQVCISSGLTPEIAKQVFEAFPSVKYVCEGTLYTR
jgi:hypothetical protein